MEKKQELDVQTILEDLIAKAGSSKLLPAKDLADALETLHATEEQTDLIYDEIEARGIRVDVSKITEMLKIAEDEDPSNEELLSVEEEPLTDPQDLSDGVDTNEPVRIDLKALGNAPMPIAQERRRSLIWRIGSAMEMMKPSNRWWRPIFVWSFLLQNAVWDGDCPSLT